MVFVLQLTSSELEDLSSLDLCLCFFSFLCFFFFFLSFLCFFDLVFSSPCDCTIRKSFIIIILGLGLQGFLNNPQVIRCFEMNLSPVTALRVCIHYPITLEIAHLLTQVIDLMSNLINKGRVTQYQVVITNQKVYHLHQRYQFVTLKKSESGQEI